MRTSKKIGTRMLAGAILAGAVLMLGGCGWHSVVHHSSHGYHGPPRHHAGHHHGHRGHRPPVLHHGGHRGHRGGH